MTINLSRLFLPLALLFLLPGYADASCIIPGTPSNCEELVSDLPWSFIVHIKEQEPIRITYMSAKGEQQVNPNLKMFLEVSEHKNREAAIEAFSELRQKAHPDMGLSYGWDLLLTRDQRVYRLHADCTLAEHHFTTMVKNLERIIDPAPPQSLLCRCGGGCTVSD